MLNFTEHDMLHCLIHLHRRWSRRAAKRFPVVHLAKSSPAIRHNSAVKNEVYVRTPNEIRSARRKRAHSCWNHLIAAPLWPHYDVNLGTLLRTCDAVGACLAVPRLPWTSQALARGNTLRQRTCVHYTGEPLHWLRQHRESGSHIVGVELAEGAIRLADLPAATTRTIAVLGHEQHGIPIEALDFLHRTVEIPMIGHGSSLNVAVAGSLVLYRLAGLL